MNIPPDMRKLIESAILAPSGDNCQPWKFQIQDNLIKIFNLPDKDTSLFNFRQAASLVAHGALIENLAIAASAQGYTARVSPFPDPALPELVASVELEKTDPGCDPLFPFLAQRVTNRRGYGGAPLQGAEREAILSAARTGARGTVRLVEAGAERKGVARIIGLNDRLVFENPYLHGFLFDHIRWTDEEARHARDGLDLKTLDLAAPDALAFRLFKNWSLLSVLNRFGVSRIVGKKAETLALSASALGAVTVRGRSGADFLNGGRLVQRVWLEATRCGLSFQPMTGIVFLMYRVLEGATGELQPEQVSLIRQAHQELSSLLGAGEETLVMVFRVGRAKAPSARSLRLPLEQVLVS